MKKIVLFVLMLVLICTSLTGYGDTQGDLPEQESQDINSTSEIQEEHLSDTEVQIAAGTKEESVPNEDNKPAEENEPEAYDEKQEKINTGTKENEQGYSQTHVWDINSYILREKFTYTFVADESFEKFITDEVAQPGETVYGESRVYLKEWSSNLTANNRYHVMTLTGSKGTVYIWGGIVYETNYIPLYKPTDAVMVGISANRLLTGYASEPLVRYYGGNWRNDKIRLQAEFDGTQITGMKIKFEPQEVNHRWGADTMEGAVDCTSFEYELLVPLEEITEKEKKEEEAIERRNPRKYVTRVKGKLDDGSYWDYRINSVYQVPLSALSGYKPDWYLELGDEVNAYLVCFTQIYNGKDRRNYTMLKFEGDKKEVWFKNGNAEFGRKAGSFRYINSEYNELISFDGYEVIRNTVEYETVNLSILFADNEQKTVKSITVELGECDAVIPSEDIVYIGGGRLTYESF